MAALGIRYVTRGGLSLPPHELPGEQTWRTDFLRWQARQVIGKAYLLPGPMREAYLARAEEAQLEEGIMTELEVHGIFECARRTLATFSSDPVTREEWDEFTQVQDAQRAELEARRKAIFGGGDVNAEAH